MQVTRLVAASAAILPSWLLVIAPASADAGASEAACLDDHKRTQELQLEKKLIDAETAAVSCARPQCPEEVRVMCTDFVTRIRASQPTVVFELRSASGDVLTEGAVAVDGAAPRPLDGVAITLDPGSHTVMFSSADGASGRATILVNQGEKDKKVVLAFAAAADAGPTFSPVAHVFYTGVASLAAFAGLGIATTLQADSLEDDCGNRCADERPGDVDALQRQAIAADVCLAAGVTLVAAAAITMGVTWTPATDGRVAVRARPGGASLIIAF